MGQLLSCFRGHGTADKNKQENDDSQRDRIEKIGVKQQPVHTYDEFDPKAKTTNGHEPGVQRATTWDISTYDPPPYTPTPNTTSNQPNTEWDALPLPVQRMLSLWRQADRLTFHGHSGAWEAYIHRHQHIWIDSAHMLDPLTQKAILLYAAMPLQIGKARKCNMTFFFTTYPNVDSPELDAKSRSTLLALLEVFNCSSFRAAKDAIKVQKLHLENEKDAEQKLVKLLRYTRQQMSKYWYGWELEELDFDIFKQLYKIAIAESEKQPKLRNNNVHTYRREIGNYRRLMNKPEDSYDITCTFLLATPLTPKEVEVIQKLQDAGAELVKQRQAQKEKDAKAAKESRLLRPFVKRATNDNLDSSKAEEPEESIAQELEKQGHPFCIEAIVFDDFLGEQAKNCYRQVDNSLSGTRWDINDATFGSQTSFVRFLFHESWIFKTTTSHDPRVDDWPELRRTQKYNDLPMVDDDNTPIQVPSIKLVRKYVFDIVDDAPKDGRSNAQILADLRRKAGIQPVEVVKEQPIPQPTSVSAGTDEEDRR
ncbi:hypothetical protein EJ05DRAFT_270675 [Pseudovirgaria hyperparasitica]|uniref:Uncharacterized protein n=1 Tax=Pseudovirgaria hyperparasitica TaxID=470096 RepID=A0A6A6VR56_9PEZI|nr:uncharacterized protein EJ05DRAFT_270675 [Pseudovirgaria hyperparasitica]KAF2752625.1 hypothetical protein EJ05DRAFT_270675 [Pseudovirgaria hyperparasitica]